jgi:hypothetical protein
LIPQRKWKHKGDLDGHLGFLARTTRALGIPGVFLVSRIHGRAGGTSRQGGDGLDLTFLGTRGLAQGGDGHLDRVLARERKREGRAWGHD